MIQLRDTTKQGLFLHDLEQADPRLLTVVNVHVVYLTDRGRLVTGVIIACWLMEVVRAMFTKSQD
jgi:hypothetical protein